MRTLIGKLLPGLLAAFAVIALVGYSRATSATSAQPVAQAAAQSYAAPSAPDDRDAPRAERREEAREPARYAVADDRGQVLICGACGARLNAPQAVTVAYPVDGDRARSIYRAEDGARPMGYAADYREPAYYPDNYAAPAAYYPEPAYYPQSEPVYAYAPNIVNQGCDPLGEIRVNPIAYQGRGIVYLGQRELRRDPRRFRN